MKVPKGERREINLAIHGLVEMLRRQMQAEAFAAWERGGFDPSTWRPAWWPAEAVAASGAAAASDEEDFLP